MSVNLYLDSDLFKGASTPTAVKTGGRTLPSGKVTYEEDPPQQSMVVKQQSTGAAVPLGTSGVSSRGGKTDGEVRSSGNVIYDSEKERRDPSKKLDSASTPEGAAVASVTKLPKPPTAPKMASPPPPPPLPKLPSLLKSVSDSDRDDLVKGLESVFGKTGDDLEKAFSDLLGRHPEHPLAARLVKAEGDPPKMGDLAPATSARGPAPAAVPVVDQGLEGGGTATAPSTTPAASPTTPASPPGSQAVGGAAGGPGRVAESGPLVIEGSAPTPMAPTPMAPTPTPTATPEAPAPQQPLSAPPSAPPNIGDVPHVAQSLSPHPEHGTIYAYSQDGNIEFKGSKGNTEKPLAIVPHAEVAEQIKATGGISVPEHLRTDGASAIDIDPKWDTSTTEGGKHYEGRSADVHAPHQAEIDAHKPKPGDAVEVGAHPTAGDAIQDIHDKLAAGQHAVIPAKNADGSKNEHSEAIADHIDEHSGDYKVSTDDSDPNNPKLNIHAAHADQLNQHGVHDGSDWVGPHAAEADASSRGQAAGDDFELTPPPGDAPQQGELGVAGRPEDPSVVPGQEQQSAEGTPLFDAATQREDATAQQADTARRERAADAQRTAVLGNAASEAQEKYAAEHTAAVQENAAREAGDLEEADDYREEDQAAAVRARHVGAPEEDTPSPEMVDAPKVMGDGAEEKAASDVEMVDAPEVYREPGEAKTSTHTTSDGHEYEGEVNNDGVPHGQGNVKYSDGHTYKGEFKDGAWHGEGVHTSPDGHTYEGEFKDGQRHGEGTHTAPDGHSYAGSWEDDAAHGSGRVTDAEGHSHTVENDRGGPVDVESIETSPDGVETPGRTEGGAFKEHSPVKRWSDRVKGLFGGDKGEEAQDEGRAPTAGELGRAEGAVQAEDQPAESQEQTPQELAEDQPAESQEQTHQELAEEVANNEHVPADMGDVIRFMPDKDASWDKKFEYINRVMDKLAEHQSKNRNSTNWYRLGQSLITPDPFASVENWFGAFKSVLGDMSAGYKSHIDEKKAHSALKEKMGMNVPAETKQKTADIVKKDTFGHGDLKRTIGATKYWTKDTHERFHQEHDELSDSFEKEKESGNLSDAALRHKYSHAFDFIVRKHRAMENAANGKYHAHSTATETDHSNFDQILVSAAVDTPYSDKGKLSTIMKESRKWSKETQQEFSSILGQKLKASPEDRSEAIDVAFSKAGQLDNLEKNSRDTYNKLYPKDKAPKRDVHSGEWKSDFFTHMETLYKEYGSLEGALDKHKDLAEKLTNQAAVISARAAADSARTAEKEDAAAEADPEGEDVDEEATPEERAYSWGGHLKDHDPEVDLNEAFDTKLKPEHNASTNRGFVDKQGKQHIIAGLQKGRAGGPDQFILKSVNAGYNPNLPDSEHNPKYITQHVPVKDVYSGFENKRYTPAAVDWHHDATGGGRETAFNDHLKELQGDVQHQKEEELSPQEQAKHGVGVYSKGATKGQRKVGGDGFSPVDNPQHNVGHGYTDGDGIQHYISDHEFDSSGNGTYKMQHVGADGNIVDGDIGADDLHSKFNPKDGHYGSPALWHEDHAKHHDWKKHSKDSGWDKDPEVDKDTEWNSKSGADKVAQEQAALQRDLGGVEKPVDKKDDKPGSAEETLQDEQLQAAKATRPDETGVPPAASDVKDAEAPDSDAGDVADVKTDAQEDSPEDSTTDDEVVVPEPPETPEEETGATAGDVETEAAQAPLKQKGEFTHQELQAVHDSETSPRKKGALAKKHGFDNWGDLRDSLTKLTPEEEAQESAPETTTSEYVSSNDAHMRDNVIKSGGTLREDIDITYSDPKADGAHKNVADGVVGIGSKAKPLPVKYGMTHIDNLLSSHEDVPGADGLLPRKGYPQVGQARKGDYDTKAAKANIMAAAESPGVNDEGEPTGFQAHRIVDPTNSPNMGPMVITLDGVVLGGNERTEILRRLISEGRGDLLKAYFKENAKSFGVTPEMIDDGFVPVRVIQKNHHDMTGEELASISSDLNAQESKGTTQGTEAAAVARHVGPTLKHFANFHVDDHGTVNAFINSKGGKPIREALHAAVGRSNPDWFDEAGKLRPEGKQPFERALAVKALGDNSELYGFLHGEGVRNQGDKLRALAPYALAAPMVATDRGEGGKSFGDRFDVSKDLELAVDAYKAVHGYRSGLSADEKKVFNNQSSAEQLDNVTNPKQTNLLADDYATDPAHPIVDNPQAQWLYHALFDGALGGGGDETGKTTTTDARELFKEYLGTLQERRQGGLGLEEQDTATGSMPMSAIEGLRRAWESKTGKPAPEESWGVDSGALDKIAGDLSADTGMGTKPDLKAKDADVVTPDPPVKESEVAKEKEPKAPTGKKAKPSEASKKEETSGPIPYASPDPESGSPIHDMSNSAPGIYGKGGLANYGDVSNSDDKKSYSILKKIKGNPDAEVTVYRTVPGDGRDDLKRGDYVTISRKYAEDHAAEGIDNPKIIEQTVQAKDLYGSGDSIHEYGYHPAEAPAAKKSDEPQPEPAKQHVKKLNKLADGTSIYHEANDGTPIVLFSKEGGGWSDSEGRQVGNKRVKDAINERDLQVMKPGMGGKHLEEVRRTGAGRNAQGMDVKVVKHSTDSGYDVVTTKGGDRQSIFSGNTTGVPLAQAQHTADYLLRGGSAGSLSGSETKEEKTETPTGEYHTYGSQHRPVSGTTTPKDNRPDDPMEHFGKHDDFKHGTVNYTQSLDPEVATRMGLQKIIPEGKIGDLVSKIADDIGDNDYNQELIDEHKGETSRTSSLGMGVGQYLQDNAIHPPADKGELADLVSEELNSRSGKWEAGDDHTLAAEISADQSTVKKGDVDDASFADLLGDDLDFDTNSIRDSSKTPGEEPCDPSEGG